VNDLLDKVAERDRQIAQLTDRPRHARRRPYADFTYGPGAA